MRDIVLESTLEFKNDTYNVSQWQLQKMPYGLYLQTDHWKHFKDEALGFYGHKCQLCNGDKRLNVHHRNYDNRGRETFNDVIVICRDCHERHHGENAEDTGVR